MEQFRYITRCKSTCIVQIYLAIIIQVDSGVFSVDLPVDHVMTLSTKTGQVKGTYDSPPSQPFPVPYEDDFESEDRDITRPNVKKN